jgi:hypothetical protein
MFYSCRHAVVPSILVPSHSHVLLCLQIRDAAIQIEGRTKDRVRDVNGEFPIGL